MSRTYTDPYHYLLDATKKTVGASKEKSEVEQLREEFDRKLQDREKIILDALKDSNLPGAA